MESKDLRRVYDLLTAEMKKAQHKIDGIDRKIEYCDPENGGTFDGDGVMIEKFKLHIGEKKQGKDKSKSPYLPVSLIG